MELRSRCYLNSRWVLHPIRIQKKLTTRGPVTAAGGPQKARASHETDGVCPGSRRTNRFGRSIWASALFSRAIGQRATKETRQRAFCGRRANHAGIFFLKSDYSHTPAACGTPTMRTARGRVLFAAPPMPPLRARSITAVFVAALVANHRPQRAERRRRAHDRQSERRARASEQATSPCHCAVLKGTHCHRGQYPIPAHPSRPRRLFYKREVIKKDEVSSPTTATSHQHRALAK